MTAKKTPSHSFMSPDSSPSHLPSVVVDHVTVRYMTPSNSRTAAKQVNIIRRATAKVFGRRVRVPIYPVRDVSFRTYDGDAIALIGENGAGKSTLLRVIGGFERPLEGQVYATSQPAHLGVNAALLLHLDAYKNARIGCLAQGLTSEEADAAVPDIIKFSGLGSAAHRAVRTYSSGMHARLRFAINAVVHPRILLIDEALGTGDAVFAKKTKTVIDEILADAGTIFMVSHSIPSLRQICNRGIWIHKGRIVTDGSFAESIKLYQQWTKLQTAGKTEKANAFLLDLMNSYEPDEFTISSNKKNRTKTSTSPVRNPYNSAVIHSNIISKDTNTPPLKKDIEVINLIAPQEQPKHKAATQGKHFPQKGRRL